MNKSSYYRVQYHFKQKVFTYIIFIYNFVTVLNFFVIKKETREKRLRQFEFTKIFKIFYTFLFEINANSIEH